MQKITNYRVLCPNIMTGMGPRPGGISLDEAREATNLWGNHPMEPSQTTYKVMADAIMADAAERKRVTQTCPKQADCHLPKQQTIDRSLQKAEWVSSCSTTLTRRDKDTCGRG
jgi:hypothetical protein